MSISGNEKGSTTIGRHDEVANVTPTLCRSNVAEAATKAPAHSKWPNVDGYEIVGELGRGGMGVVYKARQLSLKRLVALKMVGGGPFATPEFLARFQIEAEAIARLQHPNIVQVFEIGAYESEFGDIHMCPYFSLEYVDGGNLACWLRGAAQPPHEAAQFVETLARAVHYAHQHGVIHRDLKPANILLHREGAEEEATTVPPERFATQRRESLTSFIPKIGDFGRECSHEQDSPCGGSGVPSGYAIFRPSAGETACRCEPARAGHARK